MPEPTRNFEGNELLDVVVGYTEERLVSARGIELVDTVLSPRKK